LSTGLTITDLAKLSGANPRSVQHWAASGILMPVPFTSGKGTGVPRLFVEQEAVIACIMVHLLNRQITIGEMRRIANGIRDKLLAPVGGAYRRTRQMIEGKQWWLVDFGPDKPANEVSMIFVGPEKNIENEIKNHKGGPVNLLIDLTAVLSPLKHLDLF